MAELYIQELRQLRRENRQASHMLTHMQEIANILVAELELVQLTKRLSEQIALLIDARQVTIGIADSEGLLFRFIYTEGQQHAINVTYTQRQGIPGWVSAKKQAYLCNDVTADPLIEDDFGQKFQAHTVMAIPILNHQRYLLGIIQCFDRHRSLQFGQDDLDLMKAVAVQLAPAIERANLFNKMEEWANATANLLAFNASLNGQLTPPQLLQRLVEHASGFVRASGGMAGLVDGDCLHVDGYWHQSKWQAIQKSWRKQQGLPGLVWAGECAYFTNEYAKEKYADAMLMDIFPIYSAICVPIMETHENVLGFLELHNKGGGQELFTWSDVQFLESLTATMAVALRNVRLMGELQEQRQQLQELSARNITLLEDERHRIARELHDEAGQALIGIKLNLRVLAQKISSTHPELYEQVDELRNMVNQSTIQLKRISQMLRPPTLDELGLRSAIRNLVIEYRERTSSTWILDLEKSTMRLPKPIEIACYRITQEALTNILRHAEATTIWIRLSVDELQQKVMLIIRDDGCGFEPIHIQRASLGILGMEERTTMLGGALVIHSAPNQGTAVHVTIPILHKS